MLIKEFKDCLLLCKERCVYICVFSFFFFSFFFSDIEKFVAVIRRLSLQWEQPKFGNIVR